MRKSEIEKRAKEFCENNGIKEYPVEIVRICNENNLKVFEEYLESDVSGLIVIDDKQWEKYGTNRFILVNLGELATRKRFTIAHELAHYILHGSGNTLYAHRDIKNSSEENAQMEREANYFAANILMPEEFVKERVEEIENSVWGKVPKFMLIREIANSFVVSESAAEVRLKQLKLI